MEKKEADEEEKEGEAKAKEEDEEQEEEEEKKVADDADMMDAISSRSPASCAPICGSVVGAAARLRRRQ